MTLQDLLKIMSNINIFNQFSVQSFFSEVEAKILDIHDLRTDLRADLGYGQTQPIIETAPH